MKLIIRHLAVFVFLGLILCGCARISETSKVIIGTSDNALYAAKEKGRTETFACDYKTCYKSVILILKELNADIFLHSERKQRIVAMGFEGFNNTTEAGIFFTQVTPSSTKIEISSLSPKLLEYVSAKVFSALKDKLGKQTANSQISK